MGSPRSQFSTLRFLVFFNLFLCVRRRLAIVSAPDDAHRCSPSDLRCIHSFEHRRSMASFPPSSSFSPSQTLTSLDPNASALNAGLRQRRNGAPDTTNDPFRGGGAAGASSGKPASAATAASLAAPPPRSSLCLQTNSADPVTPLNKSHIRAGFPQPNQTRAASHNPFSPSGLFQTTTQSSMSSSVSTLPSAFSSSGTTSSWVCVYGVDASIQDLVMDRFASYGRIVHQKSVGVNAVAFRYDSPLSAGKALCQNRFQIRGRYCGVFAMSDNDTSLLALETPVRMDSTADTRGTTTTTTPASLFAPSVTGVPSHPQMGSGFATAVDDRDADADIYQHRKPYRGRDNANQQQQNESLCLRIMRWLLSAE